MRIKACLIFGFNCALIAQTSRGRQVPDDVVGKDPVESQMCTSKRTPDLHEVLMAPSYKGRPCRAFGDGKYCFQETDLDLVVPNTGHYIFIGQPTLRCAQDNDGSCSWNQVGTPQRYMWSNDLAHVHMSAWTNSHDITLEICSKVRFYPPSKNPALDLKRWFK